MPAEEFDFSEEFDFEDEAISEEDVQDESLSFAGDLSDSSSIEASFEEPAPSDDPAGGFHTISVEDDRSVPGSHVEHAEHVEPVAHEEHGGHGLTEDPASLVEHGAHEAHVTHEEHFAQHEEAAEQGFGAPQDFAAQPDFAAEQEFDVHAEPTEASDAGELHSISLGDLDAGSATGDAPQADSLSMYGEEAETAVYGMETASTSPPAEPESAPIYGADLDTAPTDLSDPPDSFSPQEEPALEIGYGTGNRPAHGARQVSPGEILKGDFHGSESAGDFLGLDTEFTAPADPLGTMDELVGQPGRYDDYDEFTADELVDEALSPFDVPAGADAEGFVPAADPYDYEEGYEDEEGYELELDAQATPARFRLVLLTVICALLGATGVFYGPKFLEENPDLPGVAWIRQFLPAGSESGPDVATIPNNVQPPDPGAGPQPAVDPAAGGTGTDPVPPVVVSTTDPVTTDPVTDPTTGVLPVPPDPVVPQPTVDPGPQVAVDPVDPVPVDPPTVADGGGVETQPDGPPSGTGALSLVQTLLGNPPQDPSATVGFPDLSGSGFEWISTDKTDVIWRGENLPMEAISSPVRAMMPHVGMVRVTMKSEELFEGRLFAVGQDRVWIDIEGGRIGLQGERIADISRLAGEDVSEGLVPTSGATGQRVRVRVPGGLLFGRIVKQQEDFVTIVTDEGGRVVVRSASVETLGRRRAVLIHR